MAHLLRKQTGVGLFTFAKKQISLAIATALLPNIALPQDQPDESGFEMILEEVIVTGSRIVSEDGFGRSSPVTVISMEEIKSLGFTRVEEILRTLPQVSASDLYGIGPGAAAISLRGLGEKRTLTLINGRRMQEGGLYNYGGDVNQIPPQMIERVEVLTGGASAVYGSDAVAGVVNFIMRRVDGVDFSTGISGYQHDNSNGYMRDLLDRHDYDYPTGNSGIDGKSYHASLIVGSDFADGRGNATVYAYWRKNDELYMGARDYSSCALSSSGTACHGTETAEIPNFYIAPINESGSVLWPEGRMLTLQPDSSLEGFAGNFHNYLPVYYFMRPDERWTLGAFADYEINRHATVYLESMAYSGDSTGQMSESGLFFHPAELPLDNAYFPESYRDSMSEFWPGRDNFLVYIAKRNTEGGPRQFNYQNSSLRIVAGVRGLLAGNWDYDFSYLHARTDSSLVASNDFVISRIPQAVDSRQCDPDPDCIPYQVFTYRGVSREAADSLTGVGTVKAITELDVVQAYVTGDTSWGLPAGKIKAVAGYEYRKIGFEQLPDSTIAQGLLSGWGGGFSAVSDGYNVNELFVEAQVPLLAERSYAQNMSLDLAYRWSDYSTFGSYSTYRLGLDWQSLDWLRLRTGYNRAVRAPNVRELFEPLYNSHWFGPDPCEGPEPLYSLEQCARTGVSEELYGSIPPSPSDYRGLWGGNPDLQPEKADTFTVGIVIEPAEAMQLSVDYWDIRIEGVIGQLWPELVLDHCAFDGQLCENVVRAANGTLWQSRDSYVLATQANLSENISRGVDVAWTWAPGDHWNIDLIGTYLIQQEWRDVPNEPGTWVDCAGIADPDCGVTPDWKHVASITWDSGSFWSLTGRWRFFGEVTYVDEVDQIVADNLGTQSYLDLNVVFRFADNHDVSLGVNNILDEEPPLLGGTLSSVGNTAQYHYDPLGRFLYATLNLRW